MPPRRAPPIDDLFPAAPRGEGADRDAVVEVILVEVHATDGAWLLRRAGRPGAPKWLPRALATRGEGLDADVFSMKGWVAADRGWL